MTAMAAASGVLHGMSLEPSPVLGGVTTGPCPPVGAGGGGGGGGGAAAVAVSVGPVVGVFVKAFGVGVHVGWPGLPQYAGVAVGGAGVKVGVAVGASEPLLLSVAPNTAPT